MFPHLKIFYTQTININKLLYVAAVYNLNIAYNIHVYYGYTILSECASLSFIDDKTLPCHYVLNYL